MLISDVAIAQFTSKASSAGDVHVQLGFVPDFAEVIIDFAGTNPLIYRWANNATLSQWPLEHVVIHTGNGGNLTSSASTGATIKAYAGGEKITLDDVTELRRVDGTSTTEYGDETTDSSPKHVDQDGVAVTGLQMASSTGAALTGVNQVITRAGLTISDNIQVASALNLVVAYRRNR